jgi:A/G-specific adenine glycosylase
MDYQIFRHVLMSWYDGNKRDLPWRKSKDPYRVLVSEVMLQQTRVDTAISYFDRFIQLFPDVYHLSKASQESVLKAWEGLGYYSRARNLHKAAKTIVHEYSGKMPSDYSSILTLPGVGKYIASAVLSISYDLPFAAVDGNVKRVISRLFRVGSCVNDTKSESIFLEIAQLLLERNRAGDFNQSMMELGALICVPSKPKCNCCPVHQLCEARFHQSTLEYPKKKKRTAIPTYNVAVGVVRRRGKILITKRPAAGLLGGLWEFPGGKLNEGETPKEACLREMFEEVGLCVSVGSLIAVVKHAYTHFKIILYAFNCTSEKGSVLLNGPEAFRWVRPAELSRYPFPKANLKFINIITG